MRTNFITILQYSNNCSFLNVKPGGGGAEQKCGQSPRDERESIIIKKIIRMFKQSMAPTRTESELFLKAPNTYKLQFLRGASQQDHDFLPRIKECALTSFDVNFTPDGQTAAKTSANK